MTKLLDLLGGFLVKAIGEIYSKWQARRDHTRRVILEEDVRRHAEHDDRVARGYDARRAIIDLAQRQRVRDAAAKHRTNY